MAIWLNLANQRNEAQSLDMGADPAKLKTLLRQTAGGLVDIPIPVTSEDPVSEQALDGGFVKGNLREDSRQALDNKFVKDNLVVMELLLPSSKWQI